ncbi:MAG: aldo/keto reductase [bacterium]|nr:aldo/keto reductase [bacterium]
MGDQTVSRREFLQTGAAAATVAAAAGPLGVVRGEPETKGRSMPRRTLGRTGMEVTILSHGETKISTRQLNVMHEEGVRCMDTSGWYQGGKHERTVGEWMNQTGRRKEYCLVTKDGPRSADQWVSMLDRRLANGRQDYYDLYFMHAFCGDEYPHGSERWPLEREWARVADRMRKSGKARGVGFSVCCDPIERRIELLENAAKGGWVDAIMVAADPWLIRKNAAFNKAIDACHEAGVGLIAMKELRGRSNIKKVFPGFEAHGLNAVTAVLTAMWSDERFAVICSHMSNIVMLKENAAAARNFRPMKEADQAAVHRMLDRHARGYCVGCDGSCRRAAGTQTAFNDIARYLCYYEENGDRETACRLYAALPPETRDWSGANLAAASKACPGGLDFASILARAADKLA